MFKRLAAVVAAVVAAVAFVAMPGKADNNNGDAWLTNSADAGAGHAHEPHLTCDPIYLHGSSLNTSGTFDIASIPGTGSGKTIWTGKAWSTPGSGDVLASFSASALVADAVSQDNAVANPNQGYHFKLTLHQASGDKEKTFWVSCSQTPPSPSLQVTKTADAGSVVAGSDVGFTIAVSPEAAGFANDVTLNDPLPVAPGVDWAVSPAYGGPGTCTITGTAPAAQTLACTLGDLGGANPVSATVHVTSHTVAGTTAALSPVTLHNTVRATADDLDPVCAKADIVVTPAAAHLGIIKTADQASVTAGSAVGFSVTVTSTGPGVAQGVTLDDPLPATGAGTWSISPAYGGPGTCTISGTAPNQTLTCSLGDLAAGTSASVHILAPTPTTQAISLTNVATAQAGNAPPVTATASSGTTVTPPATPNLTITKVADAVTVTAGDPAGFTMTVGNTGPGTARAAALNDPLPTFTGASWSISPAYSGAGTCSITGTAPNQALACSFGDLASGASVHVHVVTTTPAATALTLTNLATASASNNGPVTATATVGVIPTSVLGTSITATPLGTSVTATPSTQVLGESFTRTPATSTLPRTGGVPIQLGYLGAVFLLAGGLLLFLSRRRESAGSGQS